jgi:hypothetical protein
MEVFFVGTLYQDGICLTFSLDYQQIKGYFLNAELNSA